MRAGNRAESKDERDEHRTRRQRIREKGDSDVAPTQPLAHDAGTDDGRQQQRRSEQFSGKTSRRRHEQKPGAQQPAGFFARTKALMNLSLTSGATASTSRPWPVRNCRASSTP